MGIWGNAFKMPVPPDLTAEDKALLSLLAGKVRARRMELAAALAVESTRPLQGLGAQALVFLMPLLQQLFGREKSEHAAKLLENPKAADFFLKELDSKPNNGDEHVKKGP